MTLIFVLILQRFHQACRPLNSVSGNEVDFEGTAKRNTMAVALSRANEIASAISKVNSKTKANFFDMPIF